jgi:hypothetical protein
MEQVPQQLPLAGVSSPEEDKLATAIRLATSLANLEQTIAEIELQLEKANEHRKDIAERALPDLMAELGLTELTLRDGRKISTKVDYFASIPKNRMDAAVEWLKAHNMAGIVKETLIIEADYKEQLISACVPFAADCKIHPSTLKAFVKERIEAGAPLPRETFGVHTVNKAVVKNN